jgi:hypothetical protein
MVRRLALVAALALPTSNVLAEGHGQALGLKAGALGLGLEYTYEINPRLAVRGGLNGSSLGTDLDEAGINYDVDLVWDSLSVGVDFHPTQGAFRLSAGALLSNDNRLEAVSRPTQNVTVGDTSYTPSQVGTLVAAARFDGSAPFLGLGWDWSRSKRVGMTFDLGVVDQGDPKVTLVGTGALLGDPAFQNDIQAERADLEHELEDFGLAPYATLGVMFRF